MVGDLSVLDGTIVAVTWLSEWIRDDVLRDGYAEVEHLAEWSEWVPMPTASAPRLPGVYLLREPDTHLIRHVGLAGERAGGGRPQGLAGRLSAYRSGSGAVGGFAEAALDRALADPAWVRAQLTRVPPPRRARQWAADAVEHVGPEVSWAACHERPDAAYLESQVLGLLRPHGLWSR